MGTTPAKEQRILVTPLGKEGRGKEKKGNEGKRGVNAERQGWANWVDGGEYSAANGGSRSKMIGMGDAGKERALSAAITGGRSDQKYYRGYSGWQPGLWNTVATLRRYGR